jgi:quercetin dioxygenase-like cupin family protein
MLDDGSQPSIDRVSDRTPRPLDAEALAFDLDNEIELLRNEWPWREHGHNARTLLKHSGFRMVLVVLKAGVRVPERSTYNHVAVHNLTGQLRLHLPDRAVDLGPAGLLGLGPCVLHGVEALEDSVFLLCVGWSED